MKLPEHHNHNKRSIYLHWNSKVLEKNIPDNFAEIEERLTLTDVQLLAENNIRLAQLQSILHLYIILLQTQMCFLLLNNILFLSDNRNMNHLHLWLHNKVFQIQEGIHNMNFLNLYLNNKAQVEVSFCNPILNISIRLHLEP